MQRKELEEKLEKIIKSWDNVEGGLGEEGLKEVMDALSKYNIERKIEVEKKEE